MESHLIMFVGLNGSRKKRERIIKQQQQNVLIKTLLCVCVCVFGRQSPETFCHVNIHNGSAILSTLRVGDEHMNASIVKQLIFIFNNAMLLLFMLPTDRQQ